jgi:hypothetical protein
MYKSFPEPGSKDLGNSWDVVGKDSEDAKDLVSSTSKDFSTFMASWIDSIIYRAHTSKI